MKRGMVNSREVKRREVKWWEKREWKGWVVNERREERRRIEKEENRFAYLNKFTSVKLVSEGIKKFVQAIVSRSTAFKLN